MLDDVRWYYVVAPILAALAYKVGTWIWWLGGWTKGVDSSLKHLTDKVDSLSNMFIAYMGSQTVEKHTSPIALSDYGEELSRKADASSLADHYAAFLRDDVNGLNPYQIQELCFAYARDKILKDLQEHDIDRFNKITTCAYDEGIEPERIFRVVGILMRDILLKHTGYVRQPAGDHAREEHRV